MNSKKTFSEYIKGDFQGRRPSRGLQNSLLLQKHPMVKQKLSETIVLRFQRPGEHLTASRKEQEEETEKL